MKHHISQLFLLIVVVLVVSMTSSNSYDVQRVGTLLILAFSLCRSIRIGCIPDVGVMVALILLALVLALTSLLSTLPALSISVAAFFIASTILFLMRPSPVSEIDVGHLYALISLIGGILVTIYLLLQVMSLVDTGAFDSSLAPGFIHQRHMNQVQAIFTPLVIAVSLIVNMRFKYRMLLLLIGFLSLCIMFVSLGRGVVLSFVIALIMVAVYAPKYRKRLFLSCTSMLIIAFMLIWSLQSLVGAELVERYSSSNSAGRIQLWAESIRIGIDNFPFGVGGGQFAMYDQSGFGVAHPHNVFLWVLSEWGFFVLALMIWLVGRRLQWLLTRLDRSNPHHVVVVFTLLTSGIYSCFGGLALMPVSSILLVALCLWANSLVASDCDPFCGRLVVRRQVVTGYRLVVVVAIVVLLLVAICRFTLWDDILSIPSGQQYWPGFWLNGRFWDNIP